MSAFLCDPTSALSLPGLTRHPCCGAHSCLFRSFRLVGSPIDRAMTHYVAIVEDAGPESAIGIWFPDLPGCFSAGDDIDEAMRNAPEALALYAEAEAREGRILPKPRTISALKADPTIIPDLQDHMVALVELDAQAVHAAE